MNEPHDATPPDADGEATTDAPAAPAHVEADAACVGCGYVLRGVSVAGRCPECGLDVERSLRGNQLVYSSDAYLGSLERGITLILAAIIGQAFLMLLTIGLAIAVRVAFVANKADMPEWLQVGGLLLGIAASLLLEAATILGWWWFSTPDPAIVAGDRGTRARQIVRITIVVAAAFALLDAIGDLALIAGGDDSLEAISTASATGWIAGAATCAGVIAFVALVVRYFASLVYLRWIVRRVPDAAADARAGLLLWLGPTLAAVSIFCLFVPWLVALVLYCLLLNRVRLHLVAIRAESRRRFGTAPTT